MLGKILGGRYQIIRHLGGGGFGQTYLAGDLHLPGKPQCVVKQLKPRMTDPEALQAARRLFDSEAEALYALGNHEQIPRLFAHFEEGQDFYLVQEFIEGQVLSRELKIQPQFAEIEVIHLLQDLLTVLEFVHQQQVVHRDIKPSNLIRRESDRRLILIDFGAVKQIGVQSLDADEASVTIAVGSSGYMPNEQLAGKPRFSSDVYAVGMLAIQCLTGIYPKKLREDPKTSEIIWRDQVQVSPEFANMLDMMVRYDYRQRYESAKEALEVLRSLTTTAPVAAVLAEPTVVSFDGHLAWLERGDDLFQRQRYKEAIVAYDRVIQAKPDDDVAWFKRGMALENLKRHDDAAASYERVVQLHPHDYLAWYKHACVLVLLQRYDDALPSFERVVQLQPANYWAWHDRGKVLENLQQADEAIASYDRAVQLKPDFQLAVESRKQLLSQLRRVDTLYHLQHYDEALASCDRTIEQDPDDALAWFMRGMALDNLQRYEEAVVAYDRVVELQPDDYVVWFKRGTIMEKLLRYEEAVASYYKVVQIQPDNYWAWYDRGRLLESLHQHEASIASYDRAMQLKPDFQEAVEGRRRVLQQLKSGETAPLEEDDATIASTYQPGGVYKQAAIDLKAHHFQDVLKEYRDRLHPESFLPVPGAEETVISKPKRTEASGVHQLDGSEDTIVSLPKTEDDFQQGASGTQRLEVARPATSTAMNGAGYDRWLNEGRTLEKQKRYAEALNAYDQARELRPDDAALWRCRGNVLYGLERYEEAIVSYQQALTLKPDDEAIYCCVGGAFVRLKHHQDALTCFEQAIQLKPNSHIAWYWRGRALYELRQYADAVQSLEQALTIKPEFQPAMSDRDRIQHQLRALKLQT
ncbi:tetratricopeptide repeat protein [Leptolyngbya sp. FACHB-321]|uniref:serine/threonine-protein kinase n=1 Tax=Leptolyngbya sp. FACHB-321 TaxID=2692807 RepID=UPI001682B840|nr:serine/threonine-protein kinase [Leptolyngbya sp. FACHB-321]MBD2035461.1 tetratricopeptide repeat protein [Leptolyngbya sp. FACHB-321]